MAPEKPFMEARVAVVREQVPAVEALMEGQGALAITLSDLADDPVLEPGVGETPLWPDVVVCGLFAPDTEVDRLRAVLSLAPGVEHPAGVRMERLEQRDWVSAWRDRFGPMRFGQDLWIAPHGEEAPDPTATVVRLEPGLAFGSGTHPSTRLCLEWIAATDLGGHEVLDYGCGSGVLGIAAALRGARSVTCVDNDPQAVTAARDNAHRNGVSDRVRVVPAADWAGGRADVLLANILAGVLIGLAPPLSSAVRPGGALVLAGILEAQAEPVAAAYAPWFPRMETARDGEWVRLAGHKEDKAGD